jgi:glucans biosynthesis protein C
VAYYPVYRVTAVAPSWSAFWFHWTALPFWPSGPMWFLWLLLTLNVVVAALYVVAPRSIEFLGRLSAQAGEHPGRYAVALITISALAYVPLAAVFQPWQWVRFGPFGFQPSFVLPYAVYFFAGLGAGGFARGLFAADGSLARQWLVWLAAAPAAFLVWIIPTALVVSRQGSGLLALQVVADIGFAASSATSCFALVALFLRFAVRWPMLSNLSENAYGIYLIHYVFVIWLQYALLGTALFAIIKAAIVFLGALALSWITSAITCRIPLVEHLISGKRRELVRKL